MAFYICTFDYPWSDTWHVVKAATKHDAIKQMIRGSHIPESKVRVWKRKGTLPKKLAGKTMLPSGWTP